MSRDARWQFTPEDDRDKPPGRQVVRVKASDGWDEEHKRSFPVRSYLRTETDSWVREDQVELDTTGGDIGIPMGVRRTWEELLLLEGKVWIEQRLVDADFDGLPEPPGEGLLEAEGILGAVIADIDHHHCADGGWGDHSMFGPAAELADLDGAMDKLTTAISLANEKLRMLRMHTGMRANERWRADLAALDDRIRQAAHVR